MSRFRSFLSELKRRNVYRVAVTYLVVVFVGLQAVDLLVPATTLPSWADELFIALALVGFPVAVVVAWAFELTPEGIRFMQPEATEPPATTGEREPGEEPAAPKRPEGARQVRRRVIVGVAATGLVVAALLGGVLLLGCGGVVGGGGDSSSHASPAQLAVLPCEALPREDSVLALAPERGRRRPAVADGTELDDVEDTPEYIRARKHTVYRAALVGAIEDGVRNHG